MISHSQRAEYFERRYLTYGDRTYYEGSAAERAKLERTLAVLPRANYENALELGCSIGAMTEQLAGYCDRLTAVDCAGKAIEQAKLRCEHIGHVTFKQGLIPDDFPVDHFDLITMCEMGYYLSLIDLYTTCSLISATLKRGGHLLLVHRMGEIADGPLDAEIVHDYVRKYPGLQSVVSVSRPEYMVDLLQSDGSPQL